MYFIVPLEVEENISGYPLIHAIKTRIATIVMIDGDVWVCYPTNYYQGTAVIN